MGKRLTKIYTRTGDDGTTGLADGSRVAKDTARVQAIGDVDELNSIIGVMLTEALPDALRLTLTRVQHDLFDLGGELSVPGHAMISAEHIARLERELDVMNAELTPLANFILPGGARAAAAAHLARAVCRRAERTLVSLAKAETVPPLLLQYLNRLSDFLFVAARALNRHAGTADVLWEQTNRDER
ncbi:MAG: cob(I)yrinic acid a,c-diamide adenosyltransferase [Pseudomonadota bacterium]